MDLVILVRFGQLGTGDNEDSAVPVLLMKDVMISRVCLGEDHSLILKKNGEVWIMGNRFGVERFENPSRPVLLKRDESIVEICCGGDFSFMLTSQGEVYVFGDGKNVCKF